MDLQKIKALIDLLAQSSLAKLEVIEGDDRVKLVKAKRRSKRWSEGAPMPHAPSAATRSEDATNATPAATGHAGATPSMTAAAERVVGAPMFGIVHLAPSPSDAPFVEVGDAVEEGQVLCTIEAMKMFNAIESECGGTVLEVLAVSGSEVQSGQPLFRIG